MSKLKVATIVGTRPEIIKLSSTIKKMDVAFEHVLIHTGQNYDYALNAVFFSEFGLINPAVSLGVVGDSLGYTMGNVISKSYTALSTINPDAVLILGDTNSSLSAISAKRLGIPIFHMEAGNRCFDERVPEEINRRIVDHIADINLPYTEHARRNLLAEGLPNGRIFKTGSPMSEVLGLYSENIYHSTILEKMNLKTKGYVLLSIHREENVDNIAVFSGILKAVNKIASELDVHIVYSVHPRSRKIINSNETLIFHKNVTLHNPFGFFDYNKLQQNALCTLSDSGTLAEESAILDFPAVSVRTSTERPEAFDTGSLILGGITTKTILEAFRQVVGASRTSRMPDDYQDVNVSNKVVSIIQSFTPIIKTQRNAGNTVFI